MDKNKPLQSEQEAEKSVISAILNDPSCVQEVALELPPELFYLEKHQKIMTAVYSLLSDGTPVGLVSLEAELRSAGHLNNGLKASYLTQLMDYQPASTSLKHHIILIQNAALQRRVTIEANNFLNSVKDTSNVREIEQITHDTFQRISRELDQENKSVFNDPVDLLSLVDTPPASIPWLIQDHVPLGRAMLLCGVGGSSKTRMLYQLAAGIVLGRVPWNWNIAQTGRAVLVLTEDVREDVHRTVYQIANTMELTIDERRKVYAGLICFPMAGKNCCLLEKSASGAMVESALFRSLEKTIKSLGDVVLIGIDPALSITSGDELDQGHQRALGRMADNLAVRTGATVCLVSHATKASLNRDEIDSHNSRGGGAITDAVRAEYSMRTMTATEARQAGIDDIEERKRHVQLIATKGNALPAAAYVPIWLRRDNTGTMSQVDLVFEKSSGREPGHKDLKALNILRELSACATPSLQEWRAECVGRGIIAGATPDAQTKAMQRTIKKLAGAEMIVKGIGKGIWRENIGV